MRLSRDDILKCEDNAPEEVEVPEWGGTVLVRGMSGRERDAFEVSMRDQRSGQQIPGALNNLRAKVVARCVVDDDGDRLFTDSDFAALGEKRAAPIIRLFNVAARLSGLSEEDQKEMAANFGQGNGGDSSSPSPPASTKPPKNS
jgi:hypothetical protein